jgi:hypothetical protein
MKFVVFLYLMKLNPYVMVTGSCRLQVATSDSLGIFHALLPTINSSEILIKKNINLPARKKRERELPKNYHAL